MAESTATQQLTDFQNSLCTYLGWDDPTNLPAKQTGLLAMIVKEGYARVVRPSVDGCGPYEWSFLRPIVTMTLPVGANTLAMPDDYDGMEGRVTLAATVSQVFAPISVVGEGTIREKYSLLPTFTGRPLLVAEVPLKDMGQQKGQRFQLYFFPIADAAYQVQFTHRILESALTTTNPFVYGGTSISDLMMSACLAVAELRLDNMKGGPNDQEFQERLKAAIMSDQRHKPQSIGYNADRSDDILGRWDGPHTQHGLGLVSVYGIQH